MFAAVARRSPSGSVVPELRMGFAVFAEVSFVVFLSGFAAVSSALLLGFVCDSWWATRRHRGVSPVAPVRSARLSPPRNRARSPQPYSWVPPPEPPPLPSVAGPRRRAKVKAGSPVRGPLPPPLEVPFTPRVAGRWRQVLEGVFLQSRPPGSGCLRVPQGPSPSEPVEFLGSVPKRPCVAPLGAVSRSLRVQRSPA